MKLASQVSKVTGRFVGLLALASAGCCCILTYADQPNKPQQEPQDGNVEISLKLLPSAPETPTDGGAQGSPKAAASSKPDDNQRNDSDQPSDSVQLNVRPAKKAVRVLEIAIEPDTLVATEECPGGQTDSNEAAGELPPQPGDIPLEQDEHPFDVPDALSTAPEPRLIHASKSKDIQSPEIVESKDIKERIEKVLLHYQENPENVARRGPWAIMHVILPYGVDAEMIAGNRRVNAIGWLCHNGVSARQRMFQPTQTGFRPNLGPGVQGHEGQFLAILAQSRVQSDYPLQVGKRKYSIKDLLRYEMATCREKSELTFKLIAFSHYLEPKQTWKDNRGRSWSIEKLVAEELAQPINGAACGGTHRLMGLTCAVVRRQDAGLPLDGHFRRAQKFLDEFVEYTLTLQNPDGSFSTEWFERRADEPSTDRKIQTTGHILEWLVYTLPDEHLQKPEIGRAVQFTVDTLESNLQKDWPIGPRGHSLRALALYHQRLFPETPLDQSTGARVAEETSRTVPLR